MGEGSCEVRPSRAPHPSGCQVSCASCLRLPLRSRSRTLSAGKARGSLPEGAQVLANVDLKASSRYSCPNLIRIFAFAPVHHCRDDVVEHLSTG
jgi:hypothetical protein